MFNKIKYLKDRLVIDGIDKRAGADNIEKTIVRATLRCPGDGFAIRLLKKVLSKGRRERDW